MGIVVACRCGQAFEADAWLAGKVVQCPTCHSPIAVPTPAPEVPAAATYTPRPRAVARESNETTESITKILVAGGALLVMVLVLSTAIICYLRGTNPIAWFNELREQGKREREARAALAGEQQPSASVISGPVPKATPSLVAPIEHPSPVAGLPEGWRLYEHPTARFSVLLPGSLEVIERTTQNLAGEHVALILTASQDDHFYQASREFRSYKVVSGKETTTYDALVKKRVDAMERGVVEGTSNVMIDGRLVCDARLRGIEEGQEFRKYIRLIAADDWVLELSCRVPPGRERPAEINAFFGTYRLD